MNAGGENSELFQIIAMSLMDRLKQPPMSAPMQKQLHPAEELCSMITSMQLNPERQSKLIKLCLEKTINAEDVEMLYSFCAIGREAVLARIDSM